MAPTRPTRDREQAQDGAPRRRAARYAVPVALAGVVAATVGLVPALAAGDPELPDITAEKLLAKMAGADVETGSGTVRVTVDLGLPAAFGGLAGSAGPSAGTDGEGGSGSTPGPGEKIGGLLSGSHTLRVAADGPERQRLTIVEDGTEYSVIRNADDVWAHDGRSGQALHTTLPEHEHEHGAGKDGKGGKDAAGKGGSGEDGLPGDLPVTPDAAVKKALEAVGDTTSVTVDGTTTVADRDAYQLVVEPKQKNSTVDSIRVAVDAETGVPLNFRLMPSDGGKAAVDIAFTKVSFERPAASLFEFAPPKGTKVEEADPESFDGDALLPDLAPEELLPGLGSADGPAPGAGPKVRGEGWTQIAELKLPGGLPGSSAGDGGKNTGAPGAPGGFDPQALLDSLGEKVKGDFGTGTLFGSRLVNALVTEDGTVYVGAVTPAGLTAAANAAH
ncbi:LolA family protein [Streptomyces sp. HB2AG]|uniref:LolA family protein n=1 Tax=Streptomyces sp. HB2AG TaxID=2983400 RepID=UPI0022AA296C|nr:DUF2092 domain-containing protein [Streptomyces sp. HB2AG]MCZ2523997.1 DUF2092 domain-containing protein [Streptomyces sp. HB2AG]